jgi:hypothetical protein
VHSILNPTEPEGGQGTPSSSRRVSTGNTGSPISAIGSTLHLAPSPITAPHTFSGHQQSSDASPTQEGYRATFPRNQGRSPRRILTPRSRANSAGRGQTTFDARGSPFIGQRGRAGYTAGPGQQDVPPMPTPPGQSQQLHGHPASDNAPTTGRRLSMSSMQALGQRPHSQSASPSISASSVNPSSSQTSPASFIYKGAPAAQSGTSYFSGSSMQQAQGGGGMQFQAPSASGTEGPYSAPPSAIASVPIAGSSRQTSDSIQLMTITTSQGVYSVPVDVHQASRIADEKRARNAGASARFRQRRKEKEKEATTTIEKMQQQTRDLERRVRDVEEERDFYRGERDRFRDLMYRTPEMRHLATQAPPSPATMRSGSLQGPGSQLGGPRMSFQQQESPVERPTRRRRTDTAGEFMSVPYTLPPASTITPATAPGYAAPAPTNLPPLQIDNTAHPQASPPTTAPATTSGPPPFDPYSRTSYDRAWPRDGGRR